MGLEVDADDITELVAEHQDELTTEELKELHTMSEHMSDDEEGIEEIEGLLDEEDFRLPVTREEFEELCTDVFDRVKVPVDAALVSAGMDISAIDQCTEHLSTCTLCTEHSKVTVTVSPISGKSASRVLCTGDLNHCRKTTYSVEELVAQLLTYAREIAADHTDQKIKDCVLTVPPFFNQAERRAILSAAELAGLKVLSLMSSNAAVALNYGMFRRKEINSTAQNILFYDMGASSTTATIVSYHTVKTKEKGYSETNPQVSVLGLGYDRTLGGLEMQLRLRDFLAKKFTEVKKTPSNVFESPKALAKLFKEAGRLKKVLSANTQHLSQM
ncbi:hypoxia up-regulated protein 1-like [Palaemon carinicauda]|uniref:hypoxia up-regulated protein 1-like n=1 Tax=Palaemon carinicauda TaxID=392227 RepID=UPI0035B673F4